MMKKLEGILSKIHQLIQYISAGPNAEIIEEDIDAMKLELTGIQDLLCETPAQLDKRLYVIECIFTQYEKTKRTLSSANLRLVVNEVRSIASRTFPKNIAFAVDMDRDLPLVAVDGTQIPVGLLMADVDASLIDREDTLVLARHAVVASNAVVWPPEISPIDQVTITKQLISIGILIRQGA